MNPPDPTAHKRQITALFNRLAAGYDNPSQRFFPFCADRLVDHLAPRRGERVLDVATGTGAVAGALAQAVGAQGRVTAIDLSDAMLTRAEQNLRRMALHNIDFHEMDAEALEFRSGYFDALACGFGLFFLPAMETALRSWRRVLRPGGRVAFSAFGPAALNPLTTLARARLADLGLPVPEPQWYRLREVETCRQLLEEAGFVEVQIQTEQLGYHLKSGEEWLEVLWNTGFRGFLDALTPEQQAQFRQAHLEELAALTGEQGLWLDVETHFATARRPDDS